MILIYWGLWGQTLWAEPVSQTAPKLMQDQGCTTCHRFTQNQPEGTAPDLFYAGNKFQKSWLEKFLQTPVVVRKAGTSTDPDFLNASSTPDPPTPPRFKRTGSC
ncbi:MAG: hypothetical protein IH931_03480 [candidate division Zixibacteria bacterium]|nr:hypothetical protein [candidate division Zixibacteria bacterium]